MNKSESKALEYLKRNGHTNIIYRTHVTPDFKTDQGYIEVKRGYKSKNGDITILFSPGQIEKIKKCNGDVFVYLDDDDPIDIIKSTELTLEKVRNIILRDSENGKFGIQVTVGFSKETIEKIDYLMEREKYVYGNSRGSFVRMATHEMLERNEILKKYFPKSHDATLIS